MIRGSLLATAVLSLTMAVSGPSVAIGAETVVCHNVASASGFKHDRSLIQRDGGSFGGVTELLLEPQPAALAAPETNRRIDPALPSSIRLNWRNEVDPAAAFVKHVPVRLELQTALKPRSAKPVTLSLEVGGKTFGPYVTTPGLKTPVGALVVRVGSGADGASVVLPQADLTALFKAFEAGTAAVIVASEAGSPVARVSVPVPELTPLRYAANKWFVDSARARSKGGCASG